MADTKTYPTRKGANGPDDKGKGTQTRKATVPKGGRH